MGWTRVETKNAIYIVSHERHRQDATIPSEKVDCLVLEKAKDTPFDVSLAQELPELTGYKKLLNAPNVRQKPVFVGDVDIDLKRVESLEGSSRILRESFAFLDITLGDHLFEKRGVKPNSRTLRTHAFLQKIDLDRVTVLFRNAIIAEKAEQAIAPEMHRRLGRKPVIGIAYGVNHSGIVDLLQSPIKRRRLLSSFNPNAIHKPEQNSLLFEMKFDSGAQKWRGTVKKTKIVLPGYRPLSKRAKAYRRLASRKASKVYRDALERYPKLKREVKRTKQRLQRNRTVRRPR
ncbi:hypothetical protein KKE06_04555 [Candidatus Micrarchaeota archaeon]|nr:hypothetical protein [Candidatus Micrarchaeota archaeon]MBU1929968.1 hypothetical protein [Candidatus Micrarchaeota archaeon]